MSFTPLATTYGARFSAYLTTYEDFRKHRKRVNKTILRLRRDLGLVTSDTKNYKDKEKTSAISAADYATDTRYGLLVLLLAERDALYASEIKSLLELSNTNRLSYRKLMVSKLKRAAATATKALDITQSEIGIVRVELFVYAALAAGVHAVNKRRWSDALHAYSVARCGLELIGAHDEDAAPLAAELLDAVVDPSLVLAITQSGMPLSDVRSVAREHCRDNTVAAIIPAVDAISAVDPTFVAPIAAEEAVHTVTWRTHEARVHNDEVATGIGRATRASWRTFGADDYDALYAQWAVLVDLHMGDSRNTDADDAERVQDAAVLQTYLRYHMLFTRIKRDLVLIDELEGKTTGKEDKEVKKGKKEHADRDVLRLYDAVASAVEELKDLPGVYNDDDLHESLESMARFFTVQRATVVAAAYARVGRFAESLKVYAHVERTFDGAAFAVEFPYDVATSAQSAALSKFLASSRARTHALAQFCRAPTRVVADNVYAFQMDRTVDRVTRVSERNIAPVLTKAVLFDIAYNYIGYNGEEAAASGKESAPGKASADEKKKKFFGIFGR